MTRIEKKHWIVGVCAVVAAIAWVLLMIFLEGCGHGNESTPRMEMFESMKKTCDGDSSCVRDSAARSFPYGDCTHPCREKYGRHEARYCRERCLVLQRELLDEGGVHPTEADWTTIWEDEPLED